MRKLICFPIKLYQYAIRPLLRPCCRFFPSCSEYVLLAIEYHGIIKGLWLSCRRIVRCHPWAHGGYDPILPKDRKIIRSRS